MRRISLFAGPGAGKSATALDVAATLKKKGHPIEYVNEVIKYWAYQGRFPQSFEQVYIFGQQQHLEDFYLQHKMSVVTDSPIIMQAAYAKKHGFCCWEQLWEISLEFEKQFPALNLFLDRTGIEYKQEGRFENCTEAVVMDNFIKDFLIESGVEPVIVSPLRMEEMLSIIYAKIRKM